MSDVYRSNARRLAGALGTTVAILVGLLSWPEVTAQARGGANTTFSGQATVLEATLLGFDPIVVSDTGPLPPEGGALEASLLEVDVPGVATAEVAHATTVGQGKASRAEASVANLELTVAGHEVTAGFLMARASAVCHGGAASVSGGSEIAALSIDGDGIVVSGAPNQTIPLLDPVGLVIGQVVINEQNGSANGGTGEITVTALHVEVFGIADIVVSRAYSDINCAGGGPNGDFVTGGGWITGTPTGIPANFGVAGGIRNFDFWGHLTLIDHGSGMHVKGTDVTNYIVVDQTTRRIEGTARVNGSAGFTYEVEVSDEGEPGTSDTFSITLSNGYSASGVLAGGNIQLHTQGQ